MSKFFRDYCWKNGIPYGIDPISGKANAVSYKIAMDPYRKRICVEKYADGHFDSIVYDSALLDFRHLRNSREQTAWQKVTISETEEQVVCLIRNQDDRVLFLETYSFEKGRCRMCHVQSAHGVPLSVHRMFYKDLHDPFNGVILSDANGHAVMSKSYAIDESTGEFTQLLKEDWH